MEVIVQPAKGIGYGNVQVPEGVAIGDFKPAPDNRLHFLQGDLETEDFFEGLPADERCWLGRFWRGEGNDFGSGAGVIEHGEPLSNNYLYWISKNAKNHPLRAAIRSPVVVHRLF